jgi:hypothetical protein
MNKTTALTTIPTGVKPKPSRAEIIEALTLLKLEQLDAARDKAQHESDQLDEEVVKALRAFVAGYHLECAADYDVGYINGTVFCGLKLTFNIPDKLVGKSLRELIIKARAAEHAVPRKQNSDLIRKQIIESLKPVVNPSRLLSDPESRAALGETLNRLNGEA